jgi:hypothetical protein
VLPQIPEIDLLEAGSLLALGTLVKLMVRRSMLVLNYPLKVLLN